MEDEALSIREFARREGVSDTLVRRHIRDGRLIAGADGKVDASLVGSAWCERNAKRPANSANTAANSSKSDIASEIREEETAEEAALRLTNQDEDAGLIPEYAVSLAKKEHFLAKLRELEYAIKSRQVVELDVVRGVVFERFRNLRDKLIAWPSTVGPQIAAEVGIEADKATEVLTAYVHRLTSSLADPARGIEEIGAAQ